MQIEIKGVVFDLTIAELAKLQNDIEALTKGDEIALYVARVHAYADGFKFQAKVYEEKMKLFALGLPELPEITIPDIPIPDLSFPEGKLPELPIETNYENNSQG